MRWFCTAFVALSQAVVSSLSAGEWRVGWVEDKSLLGNRVEAEIAGWQLGGGCGDGGSCASGLLKRRVKITLASFVGDNV